MTPDTEELSDLDLALGADLPEDDAFNAFNALQAGTLPEAIREQATGTLRSYVDRSRAFDRPLFPKATAAANKQRNDFTRDLFTKPLDQILEADQFAAMEQRAAIHSDPDAYRSRMILKTYLDSVAGQNIPAEKFDHARTLFAREHLGLRDDTSDKAVFQAIQTRYNDHATASKHLTTAAGLITEKTYTGEWSDEFLTQRIGELSKEIPERIRPEWREELRNHYRKARSLRRSTKPIADRFTRFIAEELQRGKEAAAVTEEGADTSLDPTFLDEAIDQWNRLTPEQQHATSIQIGQALEKLPDTDGLFTRAGEATQRTTVDLGRSALDWLGATFFAGTAQAAGIQPEESARWQEFNQNLTARAQMAGQRSQAPLFQPSDGWASKAVIGTASQVPTFAAFFGGPASLGVLGASMAGQSLQTQRTENPTGDFGTAITLATTSGAAQLGLEYGMTALGLQALRGRMPTVASYLSKHGITNRYARAGIGLPAAAGLAAGTEYSEEIFQGATDQLILDLAKELAGVAPDTNWTKFFADWMPNSGSRQSQETLAAILPYALLGSGGVAFYSHFKTGQWLQQSRADLHDIGVPDHIITQIQNASPEEAAQLTREAFATGLEERSQEHREAFLERSRESARLTREAGLPIVFPETNDFTEETVHVFQRDPFDPSTRVEFETEEEAFEAWADARVQIETEALEASLIASQEDILDTLTAEESATAGIDAIPIEGYAPSVKQAPNRKDAFGNPVATPDQITARVQEFLLQGGAAKNVPKLVFKAKSHAQKLRDGTFRQIVQYFKDADPIALIEDFDERNTARQIQDGFRTTAEIAADIRAFENATGNRYLQTGYDPETSPLMPLLEAHSAIARDFTFANLDSKLLPSSLRQWVSMSAVTAGSGFAYAQELARVPAIKKALQEGRIDSKLEARIADAVGLNQEETERRAMEAYERQLAAEAMDGIPEIKDVAKGKLPHPQTLRDAQSPFTGEVQRLFDSLKRPTRRRRKDGRQVDSSAAATNYFLPYGEEADLDQIRGDLNELGFDFDTVNDLIVALDDSLNYGINHHATGNPEIEAHFAGESFSISPAQSKTALGEPRAAIAIFGQDLELPPVTSSSLFQSAATEAADGGNVSFSIGPARENYEKALSALESARETLLDEGLAMADERVKWENTHGAEGQLDAVEGYGWRHGGARLLGGTILQDMLGSIRRKKEFPDFADFLITKDRQKITRIFDGNELILENPNHDHKPFSPPESYLVARTAVMDAEADLYLALEDFDAETENRKADAKAIHQRELSQQASAFAALLDARDDQTKNAARHFIHDIWTAYGKHDELFQFGKTTSPDAEEIAAAVSSPGRIVTATDANDTIIFRGKSGYLSIQDADTSRPYISAPSAGSKGKKSGGGSQLYAAALDWMHNNGKRIKDDPAGITAINHTRRTSNFFASAIRWGTTKHLKPHRTQGLGKWTKSDVINTAYLATKEQANVESVIPDAKGWKYDFTHDTFLSSDGSPLTTRTLEDAVVAAKPDESGIGLSTLQRAIITRSAIEAFQSGAPESLVESAESRLGDSLTGVSYALSPAQDSAYLSAVESGDMETAQAMVYMAAKAAGYEIDPFFHIGQNNITSFRAAEGRQGVGVYFTDGPATPREALALVSNISAGGLYAEDVQSQGLDQTLADLQTDGNIYKVFLKNPIRNGDGEAVVRTPAQIKSADPVTYDTAGNVIPLSQRFNPADDRITFALSPASLNRLEAVIAQKMTQGPVERANFLERVRNRLAGVLIRHGEKAAPTAPEDVKAIALREAIDEAQAIIKALPPEARGRVSIPISDIANAKTQRGKVSALKRLIDKADEALEVSLKAEYMEAITKLFDLAKPDVNQASKQARGRLTPETQRIVDQMLEASLMEASTVGIRLHNLALEIEDIESRMAATEDKDEIAELSKKRAEVHFQRAILDNFGALSLGSAAEIAAAYEQLEGVYRNGRYLRNFLEDERREEIQGWRRDVIDSLVKVNQNTRSKRTGSDTFKDLARNWKLGHYSFHQFMEEVFPDSAAARHFQTEARKADTAFRRSMIDARLRWEQWARTNLNLPRKGWKRKLNRILADLSTRKEWDNIDIREGVSFVQEKLTPEQAREILAGRMKTGWEQDKIVMESLRQALADFDLARRKDQSRAEFVRFQRLKSRGEANKLHMSDMEMLYILQLSGQKQYLPTLDRWGFTGKVLEQIEAQIDERALWIGEHLASEYAAEYDRLNPVFQRLYGFDMPQIRNYAPGYFESRQAETQVDPEAGVGTPVNAMSSGFTKTRSNHMAEPRQTNALAGYWSHLQAAEYFIHWAEFVRDIRTVFNDPAVRRAIEGNYGKATAANFQLWLKTIEMDGRIKEQGEQASERLAAHMQLALSATGLAFNVGSVMKQSQAALNGLLRMSVTDSIKGLVATMQNPERFAEVWNSEPIQQRILEGMSPEDRKLLDAANANPSAIYDLYQVGRLPLAWGDAVATTIYAATAYSYHYDQAIRADKSPQAAKEHAMAVMDDIVKRTAQPATTQDRSLAELTAGRWGMLLGYIFRSDPRQKLAISMETITQLQNGKISKKEAGRRLLVGWALYGFLNEAMSDIWLSISRTDDDEDRWHWRDYLAAAIAGPLSGGGIMGNMGEGLIRGLIGTDAFGGSTAAADAIRIGQSKGSRLAQKLLDDTDDTLADLLNAGLSDARAYSTLLGAIDPRIAIGAVGARTLRDAYGIIDNLTPTETDRQDAILNRYKQTQKDERQARADAKGAPDHILTPQERTLRGLSTEHRAAAIQEILAPMTPTERTDYLNRLADVGLLTNSVRARLTSSN